MQKFFVAPEQITDNKIKIIGEDVNHISNVLRLNENEEALVGNRTTGDTYLCTLIEIKKDEIILEIKEKKEDSTEPNAYIHLFQGLPKADKMEYIIQKCTEIGVSEITPVIMSRCISKLEKKDEEKKIIRWQKIAETAAKQSKRDIIPKINFSKNLKKLYENLKDYDIVLIAYEDEQTNSLKNEIKTLKENNKTYKIAIIIGPEGGIDRDEISYLKENGAKIVSLGKRILRTETAPVVMSSIIIYELD